MKGQPDLIIQNLHKHYNGVITQQQKELIEKYEDSFRCIISNDYNLITKELNNHMPDIHIKSRETLKRHEEYLHRIK